MLQAGQDDTEKLPATPQKTPQIPLGLRLNDFVLILLYHNILWLTSALLSCSLCVVTVCATLKNIQKYCILILGRKIVICPIENCDTNIFFDLFANCFNEVTK